MVKGAGGGEECDMGIVRVGSEHHIHNRQRNKSCRTKGGALFYVLKETESMVRGRSKSFISLLMELEIWC